jgi:peptide maturation system protein (TIGR04066 family)
MSLKLNIFVELVLKRIERDRYMKNKKIMFYPATSEVVALVRSEMFQLNLEDIIICDDKGSGLEGKDIAIIDGKAEIGCTITDDFEKAVKESDIVIFTRMGYSIDDSKRLNTKKMYVKNQNKKLIDFFDSSLLEKSFMDTTSIIKVEIMDGVKYELTGKDYYKAEGLLDIEVPVIGIAALSEKTGKFELQLGLVALLEKSGYNVSWISSNYLSAILDRESFPRFMLSKDMDDCEQILFFNRYLKYIEKKEKPDVIVIGIPGAIMPCTKKITGDFGILSEKVFRAVSPDYLVLNTFFEYFSDEYLDEMKKYVKYNFGCPLNAIYVNNRRVDWEDSEMTNNNDVTSYMIEKNKVINAFKFLKKDNELVLLNNLEEENISVLINDIIECLSEDDSVISF